MLALLRRELPACTFVLVAHRLPQGMGPLRRIVLGPSAGPGAAARADEWLPQAGTAGAATHRC
jgi:hypothetical protein